MKTHLLALMLGVAWLAASASSPVPSQREQADRQQQWLKLRLERVLPDLMRKHQVQMWIVACREYNEDPVFYSLVSPTVFAARRTTIYVFHDQGKAGVERLALGGGSNGGLYTIYRDPEANNKELYLDAQWQMLRKLVRERDPRSIALNVSRTHAFSDGLTVALQEQVLEALGPEYTRRVVHAENLPLEYLETRLPEMLPTYQAMMRTVHELIGRAFSNEVITPGRTTDQDVVWWLRQQVQDLGLSTWFQPSVRVQRPSKTGLDFLNVDLPVVIQRGDVLHTDFGIMAMRLNTDTQHMGYVLREGETGVPPGIRKALAAGNRLQDIVLSQIKPDRTGNEVLLASLAQMEKEGIKGTVYSHPIGDHGHGAGPLIGLWDRQQAIPGRGDAKVLPHSWFSIELSVRLPVPEWGNQELFVGLEEDVAVDATGRVNWVLKRQNEYHLVK